VRQAGVPVPHATDEQQFGSASLRLSMTIRRVGFYTTALIVTGEDARLSTEVLELLRT
jgi:hypothetical protein